MLCQRASSVPVSEQQLYSVCKNMQARVVELIPQLADEGFIEELLMVNDDLNNAFIRYERCCSLCSRIQGTLLSYQHSSVQNRCGKPAPRSQFDSFKGLVRKLQKAKEQYNISRNFIHLL